MVDKDVVGRDGGDVVDYRFTDWELGGEEACVNRGSVPGAIGKDVIFQSFSSSASWRHRSRTGRDLGSVRDTRRLDEVPNVQIVLGWRRHRAGISNFPLHRSQAPLEGGKGLPCVGQIAGLSRYIWGLLEALGNLLGQVSRGTRLPLGVGALVGPRSLSSRLQLRFMTTFAGAVRDEASIIFAFSVICSQSSLQPLLSYQ